VADPDLGLREVVVVVVVVVVVGVVGVGVGGWVCLACPAGFFSFCDGEGSGGGLVLKVIPSKLLSRYL